jgi:hypothetical protein
VTKGKFIFVKVGITKKENHKKKNGKTLAVKPFLSGCGSRI